MKWNTSERTCLLNPDRGSLLHLEGKRPVRWLHLYGKTPRSSRRSFCCVVRPGLICGFRCEWETCQQRNLERKDSTVSTLPVYTTWWVLTLETLIQGCNNTCSKGAPSLNICTYFYISVRSLTWMDIKVFCLSLRCEKFGIRVINCPCRLHLALKPEPPSGAPQGYSQVFAPWTLVDTSVSVVNIFSVLDKTALVLTVLNHANHLYSRERH